VAAPINLRQFWEWSLLTFQLAHPVPSVVLNTSHTGEYLKRQGTWKARLVTQWEDKTHGEHIIHLV